jgi:NADPH:quinone reductase-like Zn-dependent oxidoreductase
VQAYSYDKFGGAEVLHRGDLPAPVAGDRQVVVAVAARSINLIDIRVRSGMMGPLVNKRFPKVPGADFAGQVLAVGPGVTDLKVGDRVFGAADPFKGGSFAERLAVPANQVAPLPEAITLGDAAALPIAGLAALIAMRDLGKVRAGARVLIHGATGPVGLAAIQLAKAMGAHVTAVAGAGIDLAQTLGADVTLDYRAGQAPAPGDRFDVILNASGKMPFAVGKALLAPRGCLVEPSPTIAVFIGSKIANLFRAQKHQALATVPRRADLGYLAELVLAGTFRPVVAATYGFDETLAAFAQVERGGVVGKVVVTS